MRLSFILPRTTLILCILFPVFYYFHNQTLKRHQIYNPRAVPETIDPNLQLVSYKNIFDKLIKLKLGTYHGFAGHSNCQAICNRIQAVPVSLSSFLVPIGNYTSIPTLGITENQVSRLVLPQLPGGSWVYKLDDPKQSDQCSTIQSEGVAIVIVCTNRWDQLYVTLATLIPLLQRQHLCYRIFVVEQAESGLLNKAKLLNIGFMEAAERFHFNCVVFHDADIAPINDFNPYACDEQTKKTVVHLGVGLDTRNFALLYPRLIGGALKISVDHFVSVNGYSNSYWGWGQEDDDLESRLTHSNISYVHMGVDVARYAAVPHKPQPKLYVQHHIRLLKEAHIRLPYDGLNNLNYRVIVVQEKPLFTHLLASVGSPPSSYRQNIKPQI